VSYRTTILANESILEEHVQDHLTPNAADVTQIQNLWNHLKVLWNHLKVRRVYVPVIVHSTSDTGTVARKHHTAAKRLRSLGMRLVN
jgi:hypothetical protein